jgi:hypothetical protein
MTTISVDYDGTFTRKPQLLTSFIENALLDGCTVLCVSARTERPDIRVLLKSQFPDGVMIYLTSHQPKKKWIEDRGIQVDIWIEDNPLALFESDRAAV